MGTIINLYVIAPPEAGVGAISPAVRALVDASFLELPARAGSPLGESVPESLRLRNPQLFQMAEAGEPASRPVPDVAALDQELARATREPLLLGFPRLNPDQPDVRREFDHYQGLECAVGFYAMPQGFRLLLENEFADAPLFYGTVHAWVHFQGKAAPWETLFRGSALDRAFQAVWPGATLVENDWA